MITAQIAVEYPFLKMDKMYWYINLKIRKD